MFLQVACVHLVGSIVLIGWFIFYVCKLFGYKTLMVYLFWNITAIANVVS